MFQLGFSLLNLFVLFGMGFCKSKHPCSLDDLYLGSETPMISPKSV